MKKKHLQQFFTINRAAEERKVSNSRGGNVCKNRTIKIKFRSITKIAAQAREAANGSTSWMLLRETNILPPLAQRQRKQRATFFSSNYEKRWEILVSDKISKVQMHEESLDFTVSIKLCVCGSQYSSLSAAEQYVEHLLWNIDIPTSDQLS